MRTRGSREPGTAVDSSDVYRCAASGDRSTNLTGDTDLSAWPVSWRGE